MLVVHSITPTPIKAATIGLPVAALRDAMAGVQEEYQAWTRRELARIKREEALRDPAATAADASADAGPSEAFAKPAVRLALPASIVRTVCLHGDGALVLCAQTWAMMLEQSRALERHLRLFTLCYFGDML